MSFYIVIQMCNQTALYLFSTYWFRASYPFKPLIHSAFIDSDFAKQPLRVLSNYLLIITYFEEFISSMKSRIYQFLLLKYIRQRYYSFEKFNK
ncbi:hypothetical protein Hanom_Chr08g00693061 [Helianthus anomalus]